MEALRMALLDAGFLQLHVSDLRLDLGTGTLCRTVVLQGETNDRFEYSPSDCSINFEEIHEAWLLHKEQV